jgi:hypothetical protein
MSALEDIAALDPANAPDPTRSWKRLLQVAEAELADPAYTFKALADHYLIRARIAGVRDAHLSHDRKDQGENGGVLRLHANSDQRFTNGSTFGYVRVRPIEAAFKLPPDADGRGVTLNVNRGTVEITIPRGRHAQPA